MLEIAPGWFNNIRFTTLLHQIVVEVLAAADARDQALATLRVAADGALIDVTWLEHCPLLAPLRSDPRFTQAAGVIRRRANAVWH